MTTEREMSLQEWIERLPDIHRAHREYLEMLAALKACKGILDTEPGTVTAGLSPAQALVDAAIAKAEATNDRS